MVHIRTKREIELISISCQIVSDTLDMLTEYVKSGTRIIDLDAKVANLHQISYVNALGNQGRPW